MKLSLTLISIMFLAAAAHAHDGIHEQIVAVTAEIKRKPRDTSLYLKRAELFRLHKEWRNSERDLNAAARLDPSLKIVDLRRGKLFFDMGEFKRARIVLERFNIAEPKAFDGVLALGRTLAKLGDASGAADFFQKAIELSPSDSAEIYVERAEVFENAGRFVEALDGLDEGIAKLGPIVTLEAPAIDLEIRLKRFDPAIARINRIAQGMSRNEPFLLLKGETLIKAERFCEARKELLEARRGYESRSTFQRNVRAVRDEIVRVEAGLKAAESCRE